MNRRLRLRDYRRSKVRGARRKCRAMVEAIGDGTEVFPQEHRLGCGYWHLHLPVDQGFIDSLKTPFPVRRQCVQTLIDRCGHLYNLKPPSNEPIRVVASISLPYLWDSQVIVFFGQDYFRTFFDRSSECQSWTPLRESRSIRSEWHLDIPETFQERGYHERIRDEDMAYDGELWFIGELD